MYYNKLSAVLAGILLFAFAQGFTQDFAQDNVESFPREIAFGANRGGGVFNPRILYKRTNEKRTFRASFSGSFAHQSNNLVDSDSCFTDGRLTDGLASISVGIGYEKRKVLAKKLSVFYGMEFRLGLGETNERRSQKWKNCVGRSFEDDRHDIQYSASLSWYPFLGLRYDPLPFLSFAVEVGPDLGLRGDLETLNRTAKTKYGIQPPEIREDEQTQFVRSTFVNFINLPFVTVAYHF